MFDRLRSFLGKKPVPGDPRALFAAEAVAFLRAMKGVRGVRAVADGFALDVDTEHGTRRAFLENAFAETREMSPEERRRRLAFVFGSITESNEETWEEARRMLVPVLRAATFGFEVSAQKGDAAIVRRPFVPYVDHVVAIDRPTTMNYVNRSLLRGWGIGEAELYAAAEARMSLLADPKLQEYDRTHGPLWIVATEDSYEVSRLLLPGWLASFRGRVDGSPVAIIPERSTLMVGGDGRPEMIERLLDKAEREFGASPRCVSPALYGVDAGARVVPYAPPPGHPLATRVRIAHEKLALYEHDVQKKVLDGLYETAGDDAPFVANYRVYQGPDGTVRSVSAWTEGVRTYLPQTERVMLVVLDDAPQPRAKATKDVPFDALRERLTPVPDLHPPRFETGEFPAHFL